MNLIQKKKKIQSQKNQDDRLNQKNLKNQNLKFQKKLKNQNHKFQKSLLCIMYLKNQFNQCKIMKNQNLKFQ